MIPSTRRAQRAAATRAEILEVARGLFADRGYSDVNIREIAAKSGYSTGAIFGSFPGKEALWHAAMGAFTPDEAALTLPVLWSGLKDAIKAMEDARRNIEPQTIAHYRVTDALIQARKALAISTYAEPKDASHG